MTVMSLITGYCYDAIVLSYQCISTVLCIYKCYLAPAVYWLEGPDSILRGDQTEGRTGRCHVTQSHDLI